MTLATALQRIARLTPASSANVTGQGAYVLTPSARLPEPLRAAQEARTHHYLTTSGPEARTGPAHAPAYVVTSYGVLVAWVTLDGQTHYTTWADLARTMEHLSSVRRHAVIRHLQAVRASWPMRFPLARDGEPTAYARLAVTTAS
jgi:hypothetical protein